MQYVDTHCHIHDSEFFDAAAAEVALKHALNNNVKTLMLVGTSVQDSKRAVLFAKKHPKHCLASVGIHPHEASKLSLLEIKAHLAELKKLATKREVKAVGECGFDFYYNDRDEYLTSQTKLLEGQLQIAHAYNLPVIFHVREAFDEFWPVFDAFSGIKGILHSYTDSEENLAKALQRGLLIGVNGIATFTKNSWQQQLFKNLPLENVVIETDSPFLTPSPKRGTINTPKNVIYITNFLAELRGEDVADIANITTANARKIFGY